MPAPGGYVPRVRMLFTRFRALVLRHRLFAAALTAGAGLRLLALLGYPGALFFAGDSYVYVGAALRLRPDQSKTTGYSLFLRVLEPFHSLTLVAAVQHLMGLAVAVMIYLLLRRVGVSARWSTAATLPVLLDGFEIEDEHMVMAEALFTFLIMAALLLILWRPRVSWPVALLAGLLAGYAVTVRSEGLPVLVLFPVALLLRSLRSDGPTADGARAVRPRHWQWRNWRGWLVAIAMAVGCAAPVLGYAVWFHAWNGSYTLSRAEGFYLWGRVSSFAECPVIEPPPSELPICPAGTPSSRTPPGDYIWHAPQVRGIPGGPVSAANDTLLRDFAVRAIEAQPLGYLHSVLRGLALAVEWPRQPYPDAGTVYYYYFHLTPQAIPADHSWIPGGTAYSDAVQYGHATPGRVVKPFAILIDGYQRIFYTYGPLFGLILITGLGSLIRLTHLDGLIRLTGLGRLIRLRRREAPGARFALTGRQGPGTRPGPTWRQHFATLPGLTWSPRAGSMLPWVTAIVLLVFPIAVADFDYRYLLPVLPFACLAAGLAFGPARAAPSSDPIAPPASSERCESPVS